MVIDFLSQISLPNNGAVIAGLIIAGTGAVVAIWKVRPDSSRISVDAAQGAVIVQTSVITDLRGELERLKSEKDELAVRLSELERTSMSVESLRLRIEILEGENGMLRGRVKHLESENTKLKKQVNGMDTNGNGH